MNSRIFVNPKIFKAYDIRGVYPDEINEEAVRAIGFAYVGWLKKKAEDRSKNGELKIVLGKDVRKSSPSLWQALAEGVMTAGAEVVDIGTISTDMLYFAVAKYGLDGGITVSASHNPAKYNGLKIVREKAIPVSNETGLFEIRDLALKTQNLKRKTQNYNLKLKIKKKNILPDYLKHVLSFIEPEKIKSFKVVANANFGMAGVVLKRLVAESHLPVKIIELNCNPDGTFPKGRPDPLILENRQETSELVKKEKADLAVAWDADADRCFFFDDQGEFIPAPFITALMVEYLLKDKKGERILHDTRIYWPVEEAVKKGGGRLILTKAGHTFIKERMRQENALFGGETSAHYYYRDNFYADNGMISFLLLLEILSEKKKKLSDIALYFRKKYAVSEEMNFKVENPQKVLAKIEKEYQDGIIDKTDGLAVNFENWRFSLRASNTEPLIRLNIETKGDKKLLEEKIQELKRRIEK